MSDDIQVSVYCTLRLKYCTLRVKNCFCWSFQSGTHRWKQFYSRSIPDQINRHNCKCTCQCAEESVSRCVWRRRVRSCLSMIPVVVSVSFIRSIIDNYELNALRLGLSDLVFVVTLDWPLLSRYCIWPSFIPVNFDEWWNNSGSNDERSFDFFHPTFF